MTKKEKIAKIQTEYRTRVEKVLAEREPGSLLTYEQEAEIEKLRNEEHEAVIRIERQGQKPMTRTVVRVFDSSDEYSMTGKQYFMVLDDLQDLEKVVYAISRMRWQNYNSYAVGEITDLYKDELYWSEIMDYNMKEIKVDVERVKNIKTYRMA